MSHRLSAVALDLLLQDDRCTSDEATELEAVLRAETLTDAMTAMSAEGSSVSALRSLTQRRIPFLIIKGPAAARFHPDPTKRIYSDLDLLVSPRQFGVAIEVLEGLGYTRKQDSEPLWVAFDRHCVEGFNFLHSPMGNIDLHHHVSPWRFGKNLGFDMLFDRGDHGEISGVPVRFASAMDTLLISCLHVVNDLGKDSPSYNSWRDIAILFDALPPQDIDRAFDEAGLGWFGPYIRAVLADLGAATDETTLRGLDRRHRCQGERVRLGLMGWNEPSLLARHPLGWALRLPGLRAMFYLLGAALPSRSYVQARYPNYRSYWHDALASVSAAVQGSDFRHQRIRSTGASPVGASESDYWQGRDSDG